MQNKANEWLKEIDQNDPEMLVAANLLKDPEKLALNLKLNQLGSLEVLRQANPEAWRSLNIASAERQMASIAVLEHWLSDKNNEKNLEAITDQIGLNKNELKLFVDLAGILGKYVDQAFIKQMELADLPGGSEETKLIDEPGAESVYDLYKPGSQEVEIKTYKEMFPFEWKKISSRLHSLAERTKKEATENILPSGYQEFGDFLEKMSEIYGSDNIKPDELDKEWKDLYKLEADLNKTACPIMLLPQGSASVTGDAGKVDIEMRLGLRTAETRNQEKEFEVFRDIAQGFIDEYQDSLKEKSSVPEVTFNYQPWAFGPNLNSVTVGSSDESQILVHANADREIIKQREVPILKRIFSGVEIDLDEYLRAVVKENTLHEIGHSVLNSEDKKVHKRIGGRFEASVLDEIKAEVFGLKILQTAKDKEVLPTEIDLRTQLLAKLGSCLNYLKSNSAAAGGDGEEYFTCGATIIGRLIEKNLLKKDDRGYKLGDFEACRQEIIAIGEEIIPLYTSEQSRSADVKAYINSLRQKATDPRLQEFVKNLRAD